MVCQIVLLLDLDQTLSLSGSGLGEKDYSHQLSVLKLSLGYLLLQAQNQQVEEGQNVPWISLRTYSSTGRCYF